LDPLGEQRHYIGFILYKDGTLLTTKEYRRGQGSDDHALYAVWTVTHGGAKGATRLGDLPGG
jgi:hypothetical protein